MKSVLRHPGKVTRSASQRLRGSEDGWMTPFSLVLSVAFIGLGGLAVDVSHVMTQRTQLQITADASAHAAMVIRGVDTEAMATTRAIELAQANMPVNSYGNVIDDTRVVFGVWDPDTRVFTPVPGSRDAVMVTAQRRRESDNPVPTFLLRIIGFDQWDLTAVSVFSSKNNPCFFNGALADRIATFQSNGVFHRGFCIHGNDHVSLKQNNQFLPGSIVSMPDISRLDIPASGMDGNPGLAEALRPGSIDLGVVRTLPGRISALQNGDSSALPSYTTNTAPKSVNVNQVNASTFQSGNVYNVRCGNNNGNLTLTNSMNLTNVVITTNCSIQMGNGAAIKDSIIATTNTSATSIRGTSGSGSEATVGTACAPGPGSQVLTLGGMRFPAKLNVNGGQFVAARTITFAAQATIEGKGVSLIAGNNVDWTSNADMSVEFCDEELENHLVEKRIRMVG
jgi:hypothetical protein